MDRTRYFGDTMPLNWIETENWHENEISGRGKMNQSVRSKSFLIVGGGAVGSVLAEFLIRSGRSAHDHNGPMTPLALAIL